MTVYGYTRVSTGRQAADGESLEVQERQIEGYALQHGWEVARVYTERAVSGAKPLHERPQGAKLLEVLSPGDVVITPKLDRMFRSALDALDVLKGLQARQIHLHMIDLGGDVTGDGHAKLVFTILSAVAEAERDRTRERITDIKADQKRRGRYLGGAVPFGYRKVIKREGGKRIKHLEPVPKEQAAIKRIRRLHREGKSLRAISEEMKGRGHNVSYEGVRRLLGRVHERRK